MGEYSSVFIQFPKKLFIGPGKKIIGVFRAKNLAVKFCYSRKTIGATPFQKKEPDRVQPPPVFFEGLMRKSVPRQGCQIFIVKIPNREKYAKMTTKCNK
jgi:hypothetical protein